MNRITAMAIVLPAVPAVPLAAQGKRCGATTELVILR
jgi:hypothetical protein